MGAMAAFASRSSSHWLLVLMFAVALSSAAYALDVVVQPTDQTVAPNSDARFECIVSGGEDPSTWYIKWVLNSDPYTNTPEEYYDETGNSSRGVLVVKARTYINRTAIMCLAVLAGGLHQSDVAHLIIAGPPLAPDDLQVSFDKLRHSVDIKWGEPFTHLPQFPILGYQGTVELYDMDQTLLNTTAVVITDRLTAHSLALGEREVCSSSRVCVSLRAQNQIGYSHETKTVCTNIERVHSPLPVNTTLSLHSDGRTLVSVMFQVPTCFPKAMQSKVFVEEATGLPPEPDLTPELLVPEEEGYLMEGYALAPLKQDVVYSVVVQLKSPTENTTSQPVYVTLPAQTTTSDDGGGGTVAGIVVAVLLLVLVVTALGIAFVIFVVMHRNRKDTTVVNHMHQNPFYENTYYDSIPDPSSQPPPRSSSYDSHIYQDMPELVCRLQGNGALPTRSLPSPPLSSCLVTDGPSSSLDEMKQVQTVLAEAVTRETERESEYITMHSVTETAPALQADVPAFQTDV